MMHKPFYPILFSLFPALTLAVHNLGEIEAAAALRPLLASLGIGLLAFIIIRILLKDWSKSALVTTFGLALFFSYGHVYQFLELNPIVGINLGRHRILVVVYAALLVIGIWWLVWKVKNANRVNQAFNITCTILVLMPLVQGGIFYAQTSKELTTSPAANLEPLVLQPKDPGAMPDVYFIVLDTYLREDALQRDFNFDNTPFLDSLKQMGFYIADCSRSNYAHTQPSLSSALNLEYVTDLSDTLDQQGLEPTEFLPLLKQSLVREQLEAIGYTTVAFETGYAWSSLTDADTYFRIGSAPIVLKQISPFEAMFLKTTALLLLVDSQSKLLMTQFSDVNFPYQEDIDRQLFILDQLPQVTSLPGAKFVFVHILIPHIPYVFAPDGSIRTDPGFYNGRNDNPIDEAHLIEGYVGEIQYLNSRIVPIFQEILDASKTPPVIIVMGDHGIRNDNRYQVLNAYYLPHGGNDSLYPTISPVNSFRLVFDTYFGTQYGLLADTSYEGRDKTIIPETSPACQP